ncbi:MAG: alpha-mannosidase, partial [bacterium (Candidatus Stahlbacteria) CG23_combo_of_CG06-09_8_20_14_all_40_9]
MNKYVIHIVSHTHWDREWYLPYETMRLRLVDMMDTLLGIMDSDSDYRYFTLDGQTVVLEDYLEIRPEMREKLRNYIKDGRILVGPWYTLPDEFLVSGEALVRNLLLGHRIASDFGRVIETGYLPDMFGHISQLPQILCGFGISTAVLWRGVGGEEAEYILQGPDGSEVFLCRLEPERGYSNGHDILRQ